jgi:branched-chain amino acid transport system substrate-binding protein
MVLPGTHLHRFRKLPAALLLTAVLAGAACGQKSGTGGPGADPLAAPEAATSANGTPDFSGEEALEPSGAPLGTDFPPSISSTSGRTAGTERPSLRPAGGSATSGPVASRSSTPATSGTAAKASDAPAPAEDRTGVTGSEIVIGIHAPLTGAAPIPSDSVDKAKDLYWKWIRERGGIHGRNVRVVFRDDQYNPTRAVQVCREMVEEERVFLLMGIGADQVATCARYASDKGVPYFSPGGSEVGLEPLRTYFALSMSYPAQSPMLVQLIKRTGKTRLGIVVSDTANYNDTEESITAAARAAGLQIVRNTRLSKNANQSQALAEASAQRQAGAEVVYVMVSPGVFLNLAHAAQSQAYNPQWVGPGMTSGLNLVAEFGCPSIGPAKFLSPFPQLDVIDRYDPDYRAAYRKYNNGEEADDLGLVAWGIEKTLGLMFQATGRDLSRQRFVATLESGREFASGVLPPLRFGPGKRFGATQAHLLEADCSQRRYRTLAAFASAL